jgi:hypothetical protein
MDLEVKGDNVLKSADIMNRCHLIYNFMNPKESPSEQEVDREIDAGVGESIGSND